MVILTFLRILGTSVIVVFAYKYINWDLALFLYGDIRMNLYSVDTMKR
jgi:hypothetical protein